MYTICLYQKVPHLQHTNDLTVHTRAFMYTKKYTIHFCAKCTTQWHPDTPQTKDKDSIAAPLVKTIFFTLAPFIYALGPVLTPRGLKQPIYVKKNIPCRAWKAMDAAETIQKKEF